MNNLTVTGRLTKNASELIRTVKAPGKDGKLVDTPVINFFIAVDDGNKTDKDGNKIGTEFFRVTAWRKAAEAIAKYCPKGRGIAVKGAVHLDHFTKDGTTHYHMSIPNPDGFEFLGSSGETVKKVANDVPEDVVPDSLEALVAELPW